MASGFINRRPTRIFTTGPTTSATYTTSASVGPTTAYTFPAQGYYRAAAWAQTAAVGSGGTLQLALTFTPVSGAAVTVSSGSLVMNSASNPIIQIAAVDFIGKSGSVFQYAVAVSGVVGSAVAAYAVVLEQF